MTKQQMPELNSLISQLILVLKDKLDELHNHKLGTKIVDSKGIAVILNAIILCITKLYNLRQENPITTEVELSLEDQEIVDKFLEKYADKINPPDKNPCKALAKPRKNG